ncbi:MAG: alanine--glyoxylate aminotransferase [Robiginitomaculum sp.]|nr:MAG: alanine--glyoxylate aminotransferase [Robiginitomaculum sp.]
MKPFHPTPKTLMGPGPSDVPARILEAMARPTVGHLDPQFITLMDEIKTLLRFAFQTENALTFPVSAPGSAGMETCFVNLIEPGDTVVVCVNGVFGGRMVENVTRAGATAVVISDDWGKPVDPQKVEDTLKAHPEAKILAFVHAETSTGVLSDAKVLCTLAREHDCLTIVDAVTSLGGVPVKVDEWGVDAIYSGTQKCLSVPPGLSPISFGPRAIAAIEARVTPVQSWFLDLSLVMNYWEGPRSNSDSGSAKKSGRSYHHTAPINAMYALHEGLLMLHEEGLEAAFARHQTQHEALREGLEALGFSFLVEPDYRLPQLNTVCIPERVTDEAAIRKNLLEKHDLEIGAGLGALAGKVWRIGLMGASACPANVEQCLGALKQELG